MTGRRWWLPTAGLILSSILAYLLRDVIYGTVIVPVAYVFWLAVYYYSFIPQLLLWVALLVILFMVGVFGFLPTGRPSHRSDQKRRLAQGPVESLAMWFVKSKKGTYFKWQIANRLGRISNQVGYLSEESGKFDSSDAAVNQYLEAGLTTSFVDYPRPKWPFERPAPTVLDLDPKAAVDYLESQVEMKHGRNP